MANVNFNKDSRAIMLHDYVNEESISFVNFNLLNLIKEDDKNEAEKVKHTREPIHLYISSYGGYVDDMWSAIDIILNSKTPIYTYCMGYAMSAGFNIFLAGHKRYISKHSKLMYHQLSGYNSGKYMDIKQKMIDIDRDNQNIEKYVISRTKITQKKLNEIREKKMNWYIYADDSIKLGVADEIISKYK